MSNTFVKFLSIFWLLAACKLGQAMTIEQVEGDLFAKGPVGGQDYITFKRAFSSGTVKRIVLVNSHGGDLWTGMAIARMIQLAGVDTLASGYCISSCSLMFIAGHQRNFATGNNPSNTLIGIHGAHNDLKQVDPALSPQIYALFKSQLGEKFDSEIMNQALYKIQDAGGLFRLREIERNDDADRVPYFCPKRVTPKAECQRYPNSDALSLGIVTSSSTINVTLPPSIR